MTCMRSTPIPAGVLACSERTSRKSPSLALGPHRSLQWFPLPNISSPTSPSLARFDPEWAKFECRVRRDVGDHSQTELVHLSLPRGNGGQDMGRGWGNRGFIRGRGRISWSLFLTLGSIVSAGDSLHVHQLQRVPFDGLRPNVILRGPCICSVIIQVKGERRNNAGES